MKKLFLLSFMMCLFASMGHAQDKTATIPAGYSYLNLDFAAKDTISDLKTTYNIVIDGSQHYKATQDLLVKLTKVSGSKATVQLLGAKFSTTAYSAIGSTVTWAGSTADTVIVMSNATATRYRYYKIIVTRTAGKSLISDAQFKLYYE